MSTPPDQPSYPYDPYVDTERRAPAHRPSGPDNPDGRPVELYGACAFLVLAALPLAIGGLLVLFVPLERFGLNLEERVRESGADVDPGKLLTVIQVVGGVAFALMAGFIALAALAFLGRAWARRAVTVAAGVGAALLLGAMIVTAPDPVSVGMLLMLVAGVVLLYMPRTGEYLASRPES